MIQVTPKAVRFANLGDCKLCLHPPLNQIRLLKNIMRGWVYIISNKAMPGLLKVGFTLKDPSLRARELEQTGVPHPFVVDYEVMVEDPRYLEKRIHQKLAHVRERKEWFRCPLIEAVRAVRVLVGDKALLENLRTHTTRDSKPATEHRGQPAAEKEVRPRLAVKRIRFAAKFSGPCQHCQVAFVVTVTRHESGAICPSCNRYNKLSEFISLELPQ